MLLILLMACSTQPTQATWSPAQAGQWFAADLHVHSSTGSNDTDGLSFLAEHVAVAQERGLDLLVFTDHSNSAGSMDCETGDVEDCPNQGPEFPLRAEVDATAMAPALAVGLEISPVESLDTTFEPTGHVGCLPRPGDPFADLDDAVVDRPVGTVSGGAGVAWCQDHGGFASVNHPFNIGAWIAYDWTNDDYDALEIYNGSGGGFDLWDQQGVSAWLCDLAQGRRVVGLGGSDTHRASTEGPPPGLLDQALGWPTTWIRAADGHRDTLLQAMTQGRVVVSDPGTTLWVEAAGGDGLWVAPGGTLAAGTIDLRLHGEVAESGNLLELLLVQPGDCVVDSRAEDGQEPTVTATVLESQLLEDGAFDVKWRHDLEAGALLARIWPGETSQSYGVALANPIWITE